MIQKGKISLTSRLRRMALWLAAPLLSAGCLSEPLEQQPSGQDSVPKDHVVLQLIVPGVSAPTRASMTPAQETAISKDNTHILLYARDVNDKWQFRRILHCAGQTDEQFQATTAGGVTTYRITVPFQSTERGAQLRMGVLTGIDTESLKKAAGYSQEDVDGTKVDRWRLFDESIYGDDGTTPVENPLQRVRTRLTASMTGKWDLSVPFPMWGETAEFTQLPSGTIEPVRLLRAVARIDVGVKFIKNGDYDFDDMQAGGLYDGGKGTYFALESVSVYGTMKNGTFGSGEEVYSYIDTDGDGVNDQDYIPESATAPGVYDKFGLEDLSYTKENGYITDGTPPAGTDPAHVDKEAASRRVLTRSCYVFETENKGKSFSQAACIIVGGTYGDDSAPTYYRIEFAKQTSVNGVVQKPQPDDRFDICRNNVYVVNITSVSGPGKSTPDEALNSDDTKMTAEVEEWQQDDKIGDIITDGVYSLSVDKSELQYYSDGTPETISVKTDYDGELGSGWSLVAEAEIPDGTTPDRAKELQAEFEKALLYYDRQGNAHSYDSQGFPKTWRKGITELSLGMAVLDNEANGTTRTLNGRLIIKAGRMQSRIIIRQTSQELLRILFDPEELIFGPGSQVAADHQKLAQNVDITVTTSKKDDLILTLTGKTSAGASYTKYLKHTDPAKVGTVDGTADDRFDILFNPKDATLDNTEYSVLPKYFDTQNRSFTFELTASLDNTKYPDVADVTAEFFVYQNKDQKRWKVITGTDYEILSSAPWEIIVPYDANPAGITPNIEVENLSAEYWWYSKSDDNMGDTGWITNLEDNLGKPLKGAVNLPWKFLQNESLGRRSLRLNVETELGGLMTSDSKFVITQRGKPLKLIPSLLADSDSPVSFTGTHPKPEEDIKGVYVLDHGTSLADKTYRLTITSNTNWKRFWKMDDPALHAENLKYLGGVWNFHTSPTTTDKTGTDGEDYTWPKAFDFTIGGTPTGLADKPADKEQAQDNVVLGGRRTVVLALQNVSPELAPEDVEDYAVDLQVTRELPAYTHIKEWPYEKIQDPAYPDDPSKMVPDNLDNYFAAGTLNDKKMVWLSNAPVTLKLSKFEDMAAPDDGNIPLGTVEWAASKGYQQGEQNLMQFPGMPVITENSKNNPATFYKLEFVGSQYNENAAPPANEELREVRYAYSGYKANMPLRNMLSGQRFVSAAAQQVKFNFSNSYYREMKVRVKTYMCYTDYTPVGDTHTGYETPVYYPGEAGVTLKSYDKSQPQEILCNLPANNHNNLIRKVEVQYGDASGNWMTIDDATPDVYQDGTGYTADNKQIMVYKNTAQLGSLTTVYSDVPAQLSGLKGYDNIKVSWNYVHEATLGVGKTANLVTVCNSAAKDNTIDPVLGDPVDLKCFVQGGTWELKPLYNNGVPKEVIYYIDPSGNEKIFEANYGVYHQNCTYRRNIKNINTYRKGSSEGAAGSPRGVDWNIAKATLDLPLIMETIPSKGWNYHCTFCAPPLDSQTNNTPIHTTIHFRNDNRKEFYRYKGVTYKLDTCNTNCTREAFTGAPLAIEVLNPQVDIIVPDGSPTLP